MDSWRRPILVGGAVIFSCLLVLKLLLLPASGTFSFSQAYQEQVEIEAAIIEQLNQSLQSLSNNLTAQGIVLVEIQEKMAAIQKKTDESLAPLEKRVTENSHKQEVDVSELQHLREDVQGLKEALPVMKKLLNETSVPWNPTEGEKFQEKRLEALERRVIGIETIERDLDRVEEMAQESVDKSSDRKDGFSRCPELQKGDFPEDAQKWNNQDCSEHKATSFVQYSAYRRSLKSFMIVGLENKTLPLDRKGNCQWTGIEGDTIMGKTVVFEGDDAHQFQNDAIVIRCKLQHVTRECGGYLTIRLKADDVVVYRESNKLLEANFPKAYRHNITLCVAPSFGTLSSQVIREWLDYYRVMHGVHNFVMYDFNLVDREEVKTKLQDYISAGYLTITDFGCLLRYPAWSYNQLLSVQDCMFQNQHISKWVAVADFDEFLEVVPPNTLSGILEEYQDVPWIRHTVVDWNVSICLPEAKGLSLLERAIYHKPETKSGHQKYFANPRKLEYAGIHRVVVPNVGITLKKTVLKHNHYREIQTGANVCTSRIDIKNVEYMEDQHIASLVRIIQNCSMDQKECEYYQKAWPLPAS